MNATLKHYAPVALLMAGLLALAAVCTALFGTTDPAREGKRVLAVNYPTYLAACEVVGDTDTVTVELLAGNATGCLHDYQLSPADRLAVERADYVLTVGATPFLDGVVDADKVVDLSEGLNPLCTDHDHHEEEHDHDHGESINEHVWMSPWRYRALVQGVATVLAQADAAHAAAYLANGDRYGQQIHRVQQELQKAAAALPTDRCVIFHDSLAYLAEELGLTVCLSPDVGEDSGISAADLAAVAQLVAEDPQTLLLYDSQYPVHYDGVAGRMLRLDTAVAGDRQGNDWLDAMEYNIKRIEQAGR